MSSTVFLVKAFITKSSKEKAILYNGVSAKDAFNYYHTFSKESEIEVELWDNGKLVEVIKKNKELKEVFLVEVSYFGSSKVCELETEALDLYKKWIDDVYDSKEMNDASFETKVTLTRIDNVTNEKFIISQQTIIGSEEDCD